MAENKTKPNNASIEEFLAGVSEERRAESHELIRMMQKISGEPPVMWGPSIVGFGSVNYKYASGRQGEWMRLGFSPRKASLSLYITTNAEQYIAQLDAMGKYSVGKGCIYLKRLSDVDADKLRALLQDAYDKDSIY